MIRRLLGLSAFGGVLVLVACSEEVVADKYPSVDSFCDGKAAAECKEVGGVCAVTDGVCKGKRIDACKAAAAAASGRTYKPSAAEGCISAVTALYVGSRTIDPVKEATYIATCEKVFVGTKHKNDPCAAAFECEADLVCDIEKGVCGVQVDKKLDDPCNDPGAICGTGLYCQLRGQLRVCSVKKKTDEACAADAPCLEDLRCVTGKCTPKVPAGGGCETKIDCVTGVCNAKKLCEVKQYESENASCTDFGGT